MTFEVQPKADGSGARVAWLRGVIVSVALLFGPLPASAARISGIGLVGSKSTPTRTRRSALATISYRLLEARGEAPTGH